MAGPTYDVIVVGAGIAGSASAITLGREGYRVLLLDRAVFPRHKTCGEGIMPEGVRILESLGVLPQILEQGGFRIHGLRFRSQSGIWAGADFPPVGGEPAYSIVIRRYELDDILLEQAKATSSVTVLEGFAVAGPIHEDGAIRGVTGHPVKKPDQVETFWAPLTLAADGMNSRFHNRYGIEKKVFRRQRWGLSGHLRGVEGLDPYIEVMFQEGSEVYIAPTGADTTLAAILIEKEGMRAFRGDLAQQYHEFLKATPGLRERVRDTEVIPPVGGRGPLGFSVSPIHLPGLLLIGDSAGFIDAITGEGMTLALKSVQAAVPTIRSAFETGDFGASTLRRYALERARVTEDVSKLTRLMLEVSRYPWVANRAIARLSKDERLFQKLVGIVTGTSRYQDFSLKDRWALARG
ncbi:MAG: NAD(P)/FAD-dependent oxidoreductase [Anaerolineae bacterium]|jgi:flavin-dependent dehydrogenase